MVPRPIINIFIVLFSFNLSLRRIVFKLIKLDKTSCKFSLVIFGKNDEISSSLLGSLRKK